MRLTRILLAAVVLTSCPVIPAGAAPAARPAAGPTSPASEAIRKALDSNDKFDFSGVYLAAVVNTLSEQYKINITLDRNRMLQMGFDPEGMPVELKMKQGTLRNALHAILREYHLTYATIEDGLFVSTEEGVLHRQLTQRVSTDYADVPLSKALKDLSTRCGVKLVIDPRAIKSKASEAPVTLQVDDVPYEAAVRLMCEMADLKPARVGNVIYVTTEPRADKLKDGDSLVPKPSSPLPGIGIMPFPGGLGGGLGGVEVPPAVVAPAVPDQPEQAAPKKD